MKDSPSVYLVDDDPSVRDALMLLLSLRDIRAKAYESAEHLLHELTVEHRGCVLSDLKMPGKSGLELLAELGTKNIKLPIVILTAHGDVSTTRAALRGGAFDFLEKPVDEDILVDVLTHALAEDAKSFSRQKETDAHKARINSLTPREREVFRLLGRGLQNREIAVELGISPRTVEVYKARMMEKLNCETIADVVRLALIVDPFDATARSEEQPASTQA
ncbi:MAG: response regulator transcription factor [Steroidobacteraceae bacterium]